MTFDWTINLTGLIALAGVLVGGVVAWVTLRIQVQQNAADVKNSSLKADAALAAAQLVAAHLSEHKLHIAETYITKSGHRESTQQLMEAIADVKASMTGLTTRLDRIIESRAT
jgi:hypothetical protein